MKSILQNLYNGQIFPAEQMKPHSQEYKSLQARISKERNYIKQKLSPEDSNRFDEMEKLCLDALDIDIFTGFSYGIKLGLLFGMEVLEEEL